MLEQEYKYIIPNHIKEMKDREEQVLALLKNVRSDVVMLNGRAAMAGLRDILDFVEKGEWIIPKKVDTELGFLDKDIEKRSRVNYNVNLSEAQGIINDYIKHSEKGCEYCGNLGKSYKANETGRYCKIGETEDTIVGFPISNNRSLKINTYYKDGCTDRTPTLKPLEQVLIEKKLKE